MPEPNGASYYEQLKRTPVIKLVDNDREKSGIVLAGVLPIYSDNTGNYTYLTQPVARRPGLGPPLFQLGKGTQMGYAKGDWVDVAPGNLTTYERKEPLEITALREGEEELGLVLNNIAALFSAGCFPFISSSTGEEKWMAVFPLSLHDRGDFKQPDRRHGKSAKAAWLEVARDAARIKPDHLAVIERCISLWKQGSVRRS